ncbi:MAG TPA: outer membrane protein transport protein [Polyangia bacterium]|nr:outer membrane protein transport protein [Polyangia bacterium]
MPFVDDREGRAPAANGRRRRLAARWGAGVWLAIALSATTAAAAPLDEPFVGGLGFNGPTSGTVAAIYWNPAALGLVRGTQILISGDGRLTTTTVRRASIDPTTGAPGGSFAPGSATANDLMQPVQWPIGPGAFLGISSDLGGDRFTIGFATYMPSIEQTRFALTPANNEPTRYQALQIDLRNLALVPALSVRFGDDLRLGIAPGFLFSTGEIMFDEDTALDAGTPGLTGPCGTSSRCNAENPAAAGRYDVRSGNGLGDATFSFTLGGGLLYRLKSFDIGLSYQSRPIGSAVPGVEVAAEQTTAYAPGGAPVTCPTGSTTRCVFGDLAYHLPDIWIGGFTWHARPGLEVTAMARWIWFHLQDRIDVRLTGPTLESSGLPEHIVLYRGFHDVWDVRGRVSYWLRERVRLGAELRVETSAVDASAVNAAAVDGLKIEPMVLAEGRLTRHIWLSAGYGITLMRDVTANPSDFDPTAATKCVDSGNNLDNKYCAARNAGQARPTAAGTYSQLVQDFGLAMTAKF